MPHAITCSQCGGNGHVCTMCRMPRYGLTDFAQKASCCCRQLGGIVAVGGLSADSADAELVPGRLDWMECPTCGGTGEEPLRLEEARRYLRGAA